MAKILSISMNKTDNSELMSRQIPLIIDNSLTIIMQIDDVDLITGGRTATAAESSAGCSGCEKMKNNKKKDYELFVKNYSLLFIEEEDKIKFKTNDLLNSIQQSVACIGCRTSVEKFYKQLSSSTSKRINYSLNPLNINVNDGYIYLNKDYINPKSLYSLFYSNSSKLDKILDAIPKNKKNRRCFLHSLDTHKIKNLNDWLDVWELMDDECRCSMLNVNKDDLMITLDNYLRKHRFCCDCKNKVLKAFNILIGEYDSNKEKGYCAHLFDNFKFIDKNIQIKNDKLYLTQLISRAEPEIQGSNRERHAKTIEIAQEEVLTCVGIYLYDKFHRIYQNMKSEEQTWQFLFYIGIKHLKKCFEFELECLKCNNKRITSSSLGGGGEGGTLTTATTTTTTTESTPILNKKKKYKQEKIEKKKKEKENKKKLLNDDSNEDEDEIVSSSSTNSNGIKNDLLKIDAGYSSGQESNASSNELPLIYNNNNSEQQCICQNNEEDNFACNDELIITQPKICICDQNQLFESIIHYSRIIEDSTSTTSLNEGVVGAGEDDTITDEEKNEYYANKTLYLKERTAHRIQLKEKFQNLQFSNFQIKPRNK